MTFNQQSPIILALNWTFFQGVSGVSLPKNGYDGQLDRCLQLNEQGHKEQSTFIHSYHFKAVCCCKAVTLL